MQYWCWISANYAAFQLMEEYFWLWMALFTAFLLYIPLFIWSLGCITIRHNGSFEIHRRRKVDISRARRRFFVMIVYAFFF